MRLLFGVAILELVSVVTLLSLGVSASGLDYFRTLFGVAGR